MYNAPGLPLVPTSGSAVGIPFEQPQQLFRYGEQALWSTVFLPTAAIADSNNRLFTTPIGQVGQGFTRLMSIGETNLKEGGRIPNGVAYDVFGVSCHIMQASNDNDAANSDWDVPINSIGGTQNLQNLMYNGVLVWDFTQTQVDIAPLSLCGSGGGIFGPLGLVSNAAQRAGHLGNGAGAIWLYRKHPVALPGSTTFAVILRIGNRASAVGSSNGGGPLGIKITLMGYYKNLIEIG
jgi:hypothetical protein